MRLISRCCTRVQVRPRGPYSGVCCVELFVSKDMDRIPANRGEEAEFAFILYTLLYHRQNTRRRLCFGLVCDSVRMYLFALGG